MPSRLRYLALLLVTIALGAAVRFASLSLPHAVTKYGGSAAWAAAIFWLLSLARPRGKLIIRTLTALLLACGVECFKLLRTPALDTFRRTLPGKLLLGRFFSVRDLVAYFVAILFAAVLDRALFSSRKPRATLR